MNYPKYEYATEDELHIFEFDSKRPKGIITKVVQYTEMTVKGYYNLGFGDLDVQTREINDEIVTSNGDGQKVVLRWFLQFMHLPGNILMLMFLLQEVAKPEQDYTEWEKQIISQELMKDFDVYGLRNDEEFEPFMVGEDYLGFLVKRKKIIL